MNEFLCAPDATAFCGMAARCNELAADVPEILYLVEDQCREMRSPAARSMSRLKRVGRYPKNRLRPIWWIKFQADCKMVDV